MDEIVSRAEERDSMRQSPAQHTTRLAPKRFHALLGVAFDRVGEQKAIFVSCSASSSLVSGDECKLWRERGHSCRIGDFWFKGPSINEGRRGVGAISAGLWPLTPMEVSATMSA
jgi:hypothetical protein